MKVLMLGWEFPPFFAGGVGTVCYFLTKELCSKGHKIIYLMPKGPLSLKEKNNFLNMVIANKDFYSFLEKNPVKIEEYKNFCNLIIKKIPSLLTPYKSFSFKGNNFFGINDYPIYGPDLLKEIELFAEQAAIIAEKEDFDIIHAHDWTTFKAGIKIKELTGKPLVVHIHITEFDKTGGQGANPIVYNIEKEGMDKADRIIAVSNFIKNRCVNQYFQDPKKIKVIYNGISIKNRIITKKPYEKIVLWLGRVTLQKGPDYFLKAAKLVLKEEFNIRFIIAGSGDMLLPLIEEVAKEGLSDKILFTGFVNREEADKLFSMADVFVMSSVSEPFGIVPLEAINQGTPVIISKQSGVSEVLFNALKIDFWDVKEMANKIIALLNYKSLSNHLINKSQKELRTLSWKNPARECINLYKEVCEEKNVFC